jgi:hypothetical protein
MALAAIFILLAYLFYVPTTLCSVIPNGTLLEKPRPSHLSSADSSTDTCHVDGYTPCGGNLPDDFCCSSSDTCMPLSSDTTVVCCPKGMDCNVIRTIPCDIQQLNVTAFPQNDIFTTRLGDTLPTCGDACCPFGYRCNGDNDCELEVEDVATTTSATPSKSTDKASHHQATTTTTSSVLAQTTPVGAHVSSTADEGMPQTTRTGLIVGSTVAAALLMTLLAGVLFLYTRRRNRRQQEPINDVIFHEDHPKESPGPQERRQQDPSLTKFRTWRGQSYYARADDKSSQVSPRTKIPEPIIECAELPATPPPRFKSFEFGPDVLTVPPPVRAKTTRQRFEGTKPGKSMDRWSMR